VNPPEQESKMKRNKYTPEYKAKIVLEILREEQSLSEIASRENINKNQLQNWKREFIENAARVFSQNKIEKDSRKEVSEALEREQAVMAKVGQLTLEVDYLKKKSDQILGPGWEERSGYSSFKR
jgi:transposase-like protein